MRSIRLSLIVYFLMLVGLGLGAVALLAYQTTHQALQAKEADMEKLLRREHDRRCQDERARLDERVQRKVRQLAWMAESPWGRGPSPRGRGRFLAPSYLGSLGVLTAAVNPQGHLLLPTWLAEVGDTPVAYQLNHPMNRVGRLTTFSTPFLRLHIDNSPLEGLHPLTLLTAADPHDLLLTSAWTSWAYQMQWNEHARPLGVWLEFADAVLPGNTDASDREFCELFSEAGASWQRSRSLDDHSLGLDLGAVGTLRPGQSRLDEIALPSGPNVRRVTYRARMSSFLARPFNWFHPRGRRAPPSGRAERAGPPQWGFSEPGGPTFFIVYATDTAERDRNLAAFAEGLHKQLEDQEGESRRSLADLARHLLVIGLITFALTVIGGYALVRLGLSPLHRLSEAVSRVSPRDFRLPLEGGRLPVELSPIAERLEQTLDQLKRAFAREKQAAADISHELRTPLAALLTTVDVALRKPRAPEEYREVLEDCRSSGKHMSQLVERLLALARLDAGVDTLRPREVDVTALAQQCAALVRPLAEARGLSLQVHGNGPATMKTDPDKLREVLTNLLHNAIQYNRPDGSVALSVGRENGHLSVEVRDTGIGIPSTAREHIFERFFRADPSRQADGLHAGLGLAIVKGYVDLMGGTIAVDSAEGQGSTFRLYLPA